jgi:tetratricopeptide (TPR) repeat protein
MALKKKPTRKRPATKKKKVAAVPSRTLPFEVDPKKIEESLLRLKDQVVKLAKKGRYTKVRFKFRGKQLLPDLPLAAVAAFEGVTFYWAGLLRMLAFNFAGKTVLDVELVNDSEKAIQKGKEALLGGDADAALAAFRSALEMEFDNPHAHLNVGIALKLKGDREGATQSLKRALELDPQGPHGAEAERLLTGFEPPTPTPPV